MSELDSNSVDKNTSIEAGLATSFTIRSVVIGLVFLVLGLWGVWDYVEIIPRQERFYSRAEVCRSYRLFAEPIVRGGERPDQEVVTNFLTSVLDNLSNEMGDDVESEIAGLEASVASQGVSAIDRLEPLMIDRVLPEAELQAADASNAPTSSRIWLKAEADIVLGVRLPLRWDGQPSDFLRSGLEGAENQLGLYGEIEKPSAYDRPVQWLFIICLPFVPWYAWNVMRNRSRVFRLHPDGSLDLAGEKWSSDEIADIDMSRWMRTSKAWIVHTDGHRVLLDDYVFKGVHRIVGILASQKHPEEWTEEAKPVKKPDNSDVDA